MTNPLNPLAGTIPSGTVVHLLTENGGDSFVTVSAYDDYHPTFGCWFTTHSGHDFHVAADRITSVAAA